MRGVLRSRIGIGVAALVVGATSAGAISYAIGDGPADTFFACKTSTGKVRPGTIRTGSAPTCRTSNGETVVTWSGHRGATSLDDLEGSLCRVGQPGEGVLVAGYEVSGALQLVCQATREFTLTVSIVGEAAGSAGVHVAGTGIDCPNTCSVALTYGSPFGVTASSSDEQAVFAGWSTPCADDATCAGTLTSDLTIEARFDSGPPLHTLTVTRSGPGAPWGGRVYASGGAIDCPGVCELSYAEGELVQLSANGDSAAAFDHWTGCDYRQHGSCYVTMDADRTVDAYFEMYPTQRIGVLGSFSLRMSDPRELYGGPAIQWPTIRGPFEGEFMVSRGGTLENGYEYNFDAPTGSTVTLTLVLTEGFSAGEWGNCDSVGVSPLGPTCTFVADAGNDLRYIFVTGPVEHLSYVRGPTVPTACDPCGSIDAGWGAGWQQYFLSMPGYEVTLTAIPDEGARFVGWESESDHPCVGQDATCTYIAGTSSPPLVVARFALE